MSTEYRGKIKENLWNRPVCTDATESLSLRRKARRDFKKERQPEEGEPAFAVASIDVIDEAWELGDPPIPDPDDCGQS